MRLIDADELKIEISGKAWELNRVELWKVIDKQPTIEPERTGRWELVSQHRNPPTYIFRCSECGDLTFGMHKFCGECGARMEGVEQCQKS